MFGKAKIGSKLCPTAEFCGPPPPRPSPPEEGREAASPVCRLGGVMVRIDSLQGVGRGRRKNLEAGGLGECGIHIQAAEGVFKAQPGRNVYGASSVLQMASTGAGGQTKAEVERVLGTTGLDCRL